MAKSKGFQFKSHNPPRRGQPGMTIGKRTPFPLVEPKATSTWQLHPEPTVHSTDPLGRARALRRKGKRKRDVERGEPKDSEARGG
jgi:hypothetical protein